ncbi:hypothetical protein C0992_009990 [Termitomyces sp. T32_za158]|nr:hypothetical protein C0992_009990 [Termitomyces sp. T32_za158]
MRRRKAQDNVFIGGPRYVPAARDPEGGKSPQQYEMQVVALSWPDLRQSGNGKESEMHEEDDPFLLPPSPTAQRAGRTKSVQSTTTAYSQSTYALETDDEGGRRDNDVPWESLRHKSIKRGILAEVHKEGNRIDSLRPSGTVRNTGTGVGKTAARRVSRRRKTGSDHLIDDIDQMLTGADPHGIPIPSSRPRNLRADSVVTTLSLASTTTAGDKTQWKPGRGFRIVEESPLSSRNPTPVPPPEDAEDAPAAVFGTRDRFTHAPVRHDTSRSTSPAKGARHHADMLPQSPPQITSPLLENNLCFAPYRPPRAFASPPRRDIARKLRSPKAPQLPFPRYAEGGVTSPRPWAYRDRGAKRQRPPMTSEMSSTSTTYTRSSDGRAVQALRKVGDIVERSWGARELDDEGVRALSPTGFGRRTGK